MLISTSVSTLNSSDDIRGLIGFLESTRLSDKLSILMKLLNMTSLRIVFYAVIAFDIFLAITIQAYNYSVADEDGKKEFEFNISLLTSFIKNAINMITEGKVSDLFSFKAWNLSVGSKLGNIENELFNFLVTVFVVVEILFCVFFVHSHIYDAFIDVEQIRIKFVSNLIELGFVFDSQTICKKTNLLPLFKVDSDLSNGLSVQRKSTYIFGLCLFLSVHISASILCRVINFVHSKIVPINDRYPVSYIFGAISEILFLASVISFYQLFLHICDNTNQQFVGTTYEQKIIDFNGRIVAGIDGMNPKKRKMCAAYLMGNRSFSEGDFGDKKLSDEDAHAYALRREVFASDDVSPVFFVPLILLILAVISSFCLPIGAKMEGVKYASADTSIGVAYLVISLVIVVFLLLINVSYIRDIFIGVNSIMKSDLIYLINMKTIGNRKLFALNTQIAMNIQETRVLYQCVPMVEKVDDKLFNINVKASAFRSFKDRYPDSDGDFFMKPVALKSMLIEYLREGNTQKVMDMLNVLSGLESSTASLRDLCGRIKSSVMNSRVLLNDVHFLLDQKNGVFANLITVVLVGLDIEDDCSILNKVVNDADVAAIRDKWKDTYGELPRYESPSKYFTEDIAAFRMYQKSWSSLSDAEKFKVKESMQKFKNGPKKSMLLCFKSNFVKPYSYSQLFSACSDGNDVKIDRIDDIGYVKPDKIPRGFNIYVQGQNGAGKTVTLEALLGKTNSTAVTITRSSPSSCIADALVSYGNMSPEDVKTGDLEFVPLSLIDKNQRNFFLSTISVGDLIDVPGATFKESMDVGINTNLDYVEVCIRSSISLLEDSRSSSIERDISSLIDSLWSAHSVLCSKDKDGNPARDSDVASGIASIVLGLESDFRSSGKSLNIKKYLPDLRSLLKLVESKNKLLTSRVQRDSYELRDGMARAMRFNMPDGNSNVWYFSTGENAKACIINTCINLAMKGLSMPGKAQNICLNDEALANVDRESSNLISSWFSKPLASFGITKIEIAHHSADFSIDSPDILMFFDTKLKTVLFYYRKNGRWWSEVEFMRVGSGAFQVFYLDNGAELIVSEVPNDFKLNQKSLNDLFVKWSVDHPEIKDMKDITEAELFIRNTIRLDPQTIVRDFNFLPLGFRNEVLNSFYSPTDLFEFLTILGYEYEIITREDGRKGIADSTLLSSLDSRTRSMLELYILRSFDPDFREAEIAELNDMDKDEYEDDGISSASTADDEDYIDEEEYPGWRLDENGEWVEIEEE